MENTYEQGMVLKNAGQLNAAWCCFYKALQLLEYQMTSESDSHLHHLRFLLLSEIGNIQQANDYLEVAQGSFEKAEAIRQEHLSELNVPPANKTGIFFWQEKLNTMKDLEENGQHDSLIAIGKPLSEELEALDYSQQNRENRRILWMVYELMTRAYVALHDTKNADVFDDKAADLAFLHDFDRFSSFN